MAESVNDTAIKTLKGIFGLDESLLSQQIKSALTSSEVQAMVKNAIASTEVQNMLIKVITTQTMVDKVSNTLNSCLSKFRNELITNLTDLVSKQKGEAKNILQSMVVPVQDAVMNAVKASLLNIKPEIKTEIKLVENGK
jgi:hypothetical protein